MIKLVLQEIETQAFGVCFLYRSPTQLHYNNNSEVTCTYLLSEVWQQQQDVQLFKVFICFSLQMCHHSLLQQYLNIEISSNVLFILLLKNTVQQNYYEKHTKTFLSNFISISDNLKNKHFSISPEVKWVWTAKVKRENKLQRRKTDSLSTSPTGKYCLFIL